MRLLKNLKKYELFCMKTAIVIKTKNQKKKLS